MTVDDFIDERLDLLVDGDGLPDDQNCLRVFCEIRLCRLFWRLPTHSTSILPPDAATELEKSPPSSAR